MLKNTPITIDSEVDFMWLYTIINQTYQVNNSGFVQGCGRETLWFWIWKTTNYCFHWKLVRLCLDEACRRGLFIKGKTKLGYTTFIKVESEYEKNYNRWI